MRKRRYFFHYPITPMDDFLFLDKSTQLVKRALRDQLAPGATGYLDLFHDDAVFEFPYAPGGAVRQEGKAQMAAYLRSIAGGNALDAFVLTAAYPMSDGHTTVLEYESRGHDRASGRPYRQHYLGIYQVTDGRLTLIREYFNPLAVLEAAGKNPEGQAQ